MKRVMTSGLTGGLEYDLSLPKGTRAADTVAVLLHGRGSHKGDLQGLAPLLPSNWALVTPQAPFVGAPWGYGPGWAWYRHAGENRLIEDTLNSSMASLDDFLRALPELLEFTPKSLILGGFSQGGTTSLSYAMTRPGVVDAVWNFSGFVHAGLTLPSGERAKTATPIFWGHGRQDTVIPHSIAVSGQKALTEVGVSFTDAVYDIGHWIVNDEVRRALEFVLAETSVSNDADVDPSGA
jgi:phospholipase/carboxylesterase